MIEEREEELEVVDESWEVSGDRAQCTFLSVVSLVDEGSACPDLADAAASIAAAFLALLDCHHPSPLTLNSAAMIMLRRYRIARWRERKRRAAR
jgi:hypothetical protein